MWYNDIMKLSLPVSSFFLILFIFLVACQPSPMARKINIQVDGNSRALTTAAPTVREALNEAKVTLGNLDRVKPDLYTKLESDMVIVVTRVEEKIKIRREVIPFERQTVTNEALASGESRLAQLGVSGEVAISFRLIYENGVEVKQTEISREIVIPPVPEILVVAPQGELPPVPFEGTIAYLANGNAWLMRNSNSSRRPLTTDGKLDGRVFALSPNGRYLLYTRAMTNELNLPLNELWLISTTIIGEKPIKVATTKGILEANWSPIISPTLIAYSTAERTIGVPGWKANNDLWLLNPLDKLAKAVEIMPPNSNGLYSWWGKTFAWSPNLSDTNRLVYAQADQIGLITFTPSLLMAHSFLYTTTPLINFPPYQTFSEWVWVPTLSWSPDGKFIAASVHGAVLATEPPEESPLFDLWLFSVPQQGTANELISAKVATQVGMWANPTWGKMGIAFGEAINSLQSSNSRYTIQFIDRDGSNKYQLFPFKEELGVKLPEMVWSPDGKQLVFVYNGDLYLTRLPSSQEGGSPPQPLTNDGQAHQPCWSIIQ